MSYSIRRTYDLEFIERIHKKLFPTDNFPQQPSSGIMVFWEVKKDNTRVGFAIATLVDNLNALFLCRAGILKTHRGNGLHRRLIRCRERFAKERCCSYLITYVLRCNPKSYCNLIRMGYEVYEPEYKYVGDQVLYLRKSLRCLK